MKPSLKNFILLTLMLLSAALGAALRPAVSLADQRPPIVLQTMVPSTFGEWREEAKLLAQVINPQQKSMIDKIYSQTLSRNYINPYVSHIMLCAAIAVFDVKANDDDLMIKSPSNPCCISAVS